MSLFDDIIKAIPENTNLRIRIGELKTKVDLLESENASFKDDLREKDVQIAALQKIIDQSAHLDLREIEIEIVRLLAQRLSILEPTLGTTLQVSQSKAMRHINELKARGLVSKKHGLPFDSYVLTKEGLVFADEHHLN